MRKLPCSVLELVALLFVSVLWFAAVAVAWAITLTYESTASLLTGRSVRWLP